MATGTLYLVPTGLGGAVVPFMPPSTLEIVWRLGRFIAENPKSARAFLKQTGFPRAIQSVAFETLDEHTPDAALAALLLPLERGSDCGLVSEAGCPAVADPGGKLVRCAHAAGIRVVPLVGPSALLLALMASGLNGQRFAFHGYLPVERVARTKRLGELERESAQRDMTQIFIETPYRNAAMLEAVLDACDERTLLCVASDLTLPSETIATRSVREWKHGARPALVRRPTVFLIYRESAQRRPSK
jgi:16S rRNA (cytidine1402-2'-O)-methyltransferase